MEHFDDLPENKPKPETPPASSVTQEVPAPIVEERIDALSDLQAESDIENSDEIVAADENEGDVIIEPREEHTDEMERHSRERRPQGPQGQQGREGGSHGGRGEHRGGQHNSHRPRPFLETKPRHPGGTLKDSKREILVNSSPEETRVAVLENNQLIELLIERTESEKIVGNIYKGKIENVLPGISSAFVNVGLEKNAYLYVSDVVPTQGHGPSSQIEKMIARGETIMLQVAKEAIGTKGVKVTMNISLPGRFLVYMPQEEHLGVSKNIEDRRERDRLRGIIESCAPEKGGVIIRTEADGADEQALRREMQYLTRLWESVQKRYETAPTPSLVHRDLGLVFQTVRDVFTENTSIFLVDSRTEHRDLMDFLDNISPELKSRVKLYEGKTPLFQAFHIEQHIEKIRSARVDLPSGGYIIIQEAEGLCAIDVNTGKFTGKKSQEETVTATNVEAAKEVALQLRLRNIGGIIVIDFIDMRHARNRQKVMETLADFTRDDRAKIKILPITRLGLIEMTRERKRESLFALLGEECPQCHASGRVLSRDSMYIKLKREILTMTHGRPGNQIKLSLSPAVAQYFDERRQRLENVVKHKLVVTPDPTLSWEDYRILIE
jgi:ribonuclease G